MISLHCDYNEVRDQTKPRPFMKKSKARPQLSILLGGGRNTSRMSQISSRRWMAGWMVIAITGDFWLLCSLGTQTKLIFPVVFHTSPSGDSLVLTPCTTTLPPPHTHHEQLQISDQSGSNSLVHDHLLRRQFWLDDVLRANSGNYQTRENKNMHFFFFT